MFFEECVHGTDSFRGTSGVDVIMEREQMFTLLTEAPPAFRRVRFAGQDRGMRASPLPRRPV